MTKKESTMVLYEGGYIPFSTWKKLMRMPVSKRRDVSKTIPKDIPIQTPPPTLAIPKPKKQSSTFRLKMVKKELDLLEPHLEFVKRMVAQVVFDNPRYLKPSKWSKIQIPIVNSPHTRFCAWLAETRGGRVTHEEINHFDSQGINPDVRVNKLKGRRRKEVHEVEVIAMNDSRPRKYIKFGRRHRAKRFLWIVLPMDTRKAFDEITLVEIPKPKEL